MTRQAARLLCVLSALAGVARAADRPGPNVVVILADDLGWGDVSKFNPGSKIATPRIDALAARGLRFTDAHSGSAVCTPTRYGLLTGRYAWRSRLKRGVLGGYSPHLIEPGRTTVASLLKAHGYRTAVVGKWHLGLDWVTTAPARLGDANDAKVDAGPPVDYSAEVRNGPRAIGFDESFLLSASLDMPPYVFLRDDRCVALPTAERTYIRRGPAAPDFQAVDVLPTLEREAVAFLERQARSGREKPFFLYLALTAPHTPIVPTAEVRGRTGLGDYGDFVAQVDATVGRVLDALERNGQDGDTLLFFTSDNGCSPAADTAALERKGHHASGPYRGYKADIFEGGHRIPLVVRWPGKVKAGTSYDETVCLTDVLATCAGVVGATLPETAGEDSVSLLPALLGQAGRPLREATVHHSIDGSFAIRQGPWKLALCPDSGGWSDPKPGSAAAKGLRPLQLYNLRDDPGETRNVEAQHPELVDRLTRLLQRYVSEGRSTPGPRQPNDAPVAIRRPTRS